MVERWQPPPNAARLTPNEPPQRLVIHLQDLHTQAEAQKNLSDLIGYLHDKLGISLVALEGAEGLCDTTLYSDLPDPPSTERIAKLFLQEGLFTGAEYYGITHPGHVTLWGIEDQAIYLKHLEAYRQSETIRVSLAQTLKQFAPALAQTKRRLYPKTLRDLDAARATYDAGTLAFKDYFARLLAAAKTQHLALTEYPALQRLQQWYALNAATDLTEVEREHQALFAEITPRVTLADRAALFALADQLHAQQIPPLRYYQQLKQVAQGAGVDLTTPTPSSKTQRPVIASVAKQSLVGLLRRSTPRNDARYSHLARYITLLEWSAESSSKALSREVDVMHERLAQQLADSPAAQRLWTLSKQLGILQGLLNVRLTPDEWAYYQQHRDEFTLSKLSANAASLTGHSLFKSTAGEDVSLTALEDFYRLALQRDHLFVERTLAHLNDVPATILITGGFHTPGITQQLKECHVAYVVIAPTAAGEMDESLYRARLDNALPPLTELWRQLDSQSLNAPLSTGVSSAQPITLELPTPMGSRLDAAHDVTLPKRDAVYLAFFLTKWALVRRTLADWTTRLRTWINAHPEVVKRYAIALLVTSAGVIILSALGVEVHFDAQHGTMLSMMAMGGIKHIGGESEDTSLWTVVREQNPAPDFELPVGTTVEAVALDDLAPGTLIQYIIGDGNVVQRQYIYTIRIENDGRFTIWIVGPTFKESYGLQASQVLDREGRAANVIQRGHALLMPYFYPEPQAPGQANVFMMAPLHIKVLTPADVAKAPAIAAQLEEEEARYRPITTPLRRGDFATARAVLQTLRAAAMAGDQKLRSEELDRLAGIIDRVEETWSELALTRAELLAMKYPRQWQSDSLPAKLAREAQLGQVRGIADELSSVLLWNAANIEPTQLEDNLAQQADLTHSIENLRQSGEFLHGISTKQLITTFEDDLKRLRSEETFLRATPTTPAKLPHSRVNAYIAEHLPEDLRNDRAALLTYNVARGSDVSARIVPVPGLLKATGQLAHIGLGQVYGEPVIYVDADYATNDAVLQHELYEIAKWEAKRKEFGLEPQQMRQWMLDHFEEANQLAEQWHREAPSVEHLLTAAPREEITEVYAAERDINLAAGPTPRTAQLSAVAHDYLRQAVIERRVQMILAANSLQTWQAVARYMGGAVNAEALGRFMNELYNRAVAELQQAGNSLRGQEALWTVGHKMLELLEAERAAIPEAPPTPRQEIRRATATPKTTALTRFFEGIWSEFIIAVANQDYGQRALEKQLIREAQAIDPQAGDMMQALVDALRPANKDPASQGWKSRLKSLLGGQPAASGLSDQRIGEEVLARWRTFNRDYLVPNGFYGTITITHDLQRDVYYYHAVMYRVERQERKTVNGGEVVDVIYGRKADRTNLIGAQGHSIPGERVVFIDLNEVDKKVGKIRATAHRGAPYLLEESTGLQAPAVMRWIQRTYGRMSEAEIRVSVERSLRAHELTHKAQEYAGIRYQLSDRFGIPAELWYQFTERFREAIEHEIAAYTAQMALADQPGEVLVHLLPHLVRGQGTPEYFAARYLFNRLANIPEGRWVDWRDANACVRLFEQLANASDLARRAERLYSDGFRGLGLVQPIVGREQIPFALVGLGGAIAATIAVFIAGASLWLVPIVALGLAAAYAAFDFGTIAAEERWLQFRAHRNWLSPPSDEHLTTLKMRLQEQYPGIIFHDLPVTDTRFADVIHDHPIIRINWTRFAQLSPRAQHSILRHEFAHTQGAGELVARIAQASPHLAAFISRLFHLTPARDAATPDTSLTDVGHLLRVTDDLQRSP